jgi:signal transduction histidine kinase
VWVLVSARPRYDEAGEFNGSFAMVADISELKEAQARHRRLLRRVGVAEDEERRRLAEELHDGPMQELAATALRLGTLRLGLDDEETASRVREIEVATRATLRELRALMFALQPPEIGDGGLVPALRSCATLLFADTGTDIVIEGSLPREPTEAIATTAYRIVREACANARLHAQATQVRVTVEEDDDAVVLTVVDDGVGIDPAVLRDGAPGHLGLRTMRERAEAAGGSCTVDRGPTGGTVMVARLPLSDEAAD